MLLKKKKKKNQLIISKSCLKAIIFNGLLALTIDTYLRYFQYQIWTTTIYLNQKLFIFCLKNFVRFFCYLFEETPIQMFYECKLVIFLWKQLKTYFNENLDTKNCYFRTCLTNKQYKIVINQLFVFKLHVFKWRK